MNSVWTNFSSLGPLQHTPRRRRVAFPEVAVLSGGCCMRKAWCVVGEFNGCEHWGGCHEWCQGSDCSQLIKALPCLLKSGSFFLGRPCKTILERTNGQKWRPEQACMLTALKHRERSGEHGRGVEGALTDNHDKCLWLFFHTWKCNKHQAKHLQVGIWAIFI